MRANEVVFKRGRNFTACYYVYEGEYVAARIWVRTGSYGGEFSITDSTPKNIAVAKAKRWLKNQIKELENAKV